MKNTERILAEQAVAGDTDAFVELMKGYTDSMYRVARGFLREDEDVADAIQETILNCLEHGCEVRKPQYYKTWMIRILINNCKDILREKCQTYGEDELIQCTSDSHLKLGEVELKDTLEQLDEKYRAVIVLHYLEGFKVKEIGEILSMNIATVKTRLSRGRKELQKIYGVKIEKEEKKSNSFFMREASHYAK